MNTKEICLSEAGMFQILQTIGCMDMPLLAAKAGGAREYLAACREWEELGWGEPDFDGGFHPSGQFARIVYSLKETRSAIRYDGAEGECIIYLRSLVDLICLKKLAVETDRWRFCFCPLKCVRREFSRMLVAAQGGALRVQEVGGQAMEVNLADTSAGSDARMRAINDQLVRFYEKYGAKGEWER